MGVISKETLKKEEGIKNADNDIVFELENDLKDLETYIRDFWHFLPLPICYVNPVHNILDVDDFLVKFSGYTSNEAIGEDVSIFFNDTKIEDLKKRILKEDTISFDKVTFLTKDKKEIPVTLLAMARKTEKGEVIGYFLSMIDIAETINFQKRLEEEVTKKTQEYQEKAKELDDSRKALMNILEDVEDARLDAVRERDKTISIINHFVDGIIVLDKENNLELINPAAEKMFGINNNECKGKNIKHLQENPHFSKALALIWKDFIKELERAEFTLDQENTLEVTTISLKEKDKNFGFLVIFHDITREKMVERLKTEFVSVAAHQLRTPLSAIRWSISLLQEENLSQEDRDDLIEKCSLSNDRMINLVNDLLNVSRIEEGRYIYELKPKDILEITKQSIAAALQEAVNKKVDFQVSWPKQKIPFLEVDEEKISLAIQNLAENAVHYTSDGGKIELKIELDKANKKVLFTLQDSGVGIPKNQQARIFTKFFRAENVVRMETEGSGLGLFITKNVIEAHGGKVWFDSEEGKGTIFHFSLPIKEEKFEEFLEEF
jgi:PAS domain S-box-containing protein